MFPNQPMLPPMPKFPEYVKDKYIWVARFKDVNDASKGTYLTQALVKDLYPYDELFVARVDMEGCEGAMVTYNGVIYKGQVTKTDPLQTTLHDIGFVMQIIDRK